MRSPVAPKVSVVIVSAHRPKALRRCLRGFEAQVDAPPWELLVCANGDASVLAEVAKRFPQATTRLIDRTHPGRARNAVTKLARGDIVLFVDDDVEPHRDLLHRLSELADANPEIGIFGGPNLTPAGSSKFQIVQGAVLASLISSGPVRRRYGRHPASVADERFFMLCNLAIRREEIVAFDDTLICAEENRLMNELKARGVKMLYDPSLAVFHDRRAHLKGFVAQLFKYGVGRGQVCLRDPRSMRPAHVAPVMLLAFLVATPVLAASSPLWLLGAGAYALILGVNGAVVSATLRRPTTFPLATAMTLLIHVVYATGIVTAVVRGGRIARKTSPG